VSERRAVYIVGNIYHVDFGKIHFKLDGDSPESVTYGLGPSHKNTRPISLKVGVNALYVKARDEQQFSDVDSLVTLILGLTKLLEEEEDTDRDAYESVVIALRLATVELQLAVRERDTRPNATESLANEALIRYQQLIECSGGELFTISDGDIVVFIPTSIYINMAIVYRLLGNPEKAQQCLEEAEHSLDILFSKGQEGVKNMIRQAISKSRTLDI